MIQVNELRIGNTTNKGAIVSFYEHGIHVGYGKCYDFQELEPIPLTEEILLKCGFEESQYHFCIGDFIIRKPDFVLCDIGIKVNPINLHQLQNLYFALTGKELKIKL